MSVFHSTLSRREFMKNLGFVGAGIGAASLVAPAFHDLDEMMASPSATQKRPWFVKERNFLDPSVEHDWDAITRYDRRWQSQTNRIKTYFKYNGDAAYKAELAAKGDAISKSRTFDTPGYTLRSRILSSSKLENLNWSKSWTGPVKSGSNTYTEAKTPEELGTSKWTGSPEEASKMMNAAMRFYGSVMTGFAEFDSTWKNKVLAAYTTRGATKDWASNNGALPSDAESMRFVFEDVDKGYATADKMVFPNKPLWIITSISPVASQFLKAPNASKGYNSSSFPGPNGTGGTLSSLTYGGTARFLRGLGYEFYSDTGHQSSPFNENMANQLTGINEQSRQQNYALNAEYGNATYPTTIQTNLPLAATPPVDAGMWRFCKTCGFCAINCPAGSIEEHHEPTWDIPTYEGKEVTFHNKGIKAFWNNFIRCQEYRTEASGCSQCWGYCTFSVDQAAMVHALVKQTISITPLFNSFFATMGEAFGYGNQDSPEDYWEMSLPMMGVDTVKSAWKGR